MRNVKYTTLVKPDTFIERQVHNAGQARYIHRAIHVVHVGARNPDSV